MDLSARLAQNRFLVIGRVGMDLFPDPHVAIENATGFHADIGGSAANMAVGIVKLGGQAALLTRVSDDAVGRFCVQKLDVYGVDTAHVTPTGGEARNSLALFESRVVGHQSVIYRNGAADFQMTVQDVAAVDYSRYGAVITAGTVFAADPSRKAAFHAFGLARAAGVPIIFDVDYRPYSWPSAQVAAQVLSDAGARADIIVGNDDEFGFMAGNKAQGRAMARDLARQSAAIVIYKMGEHGAITFCGDAEIHTGIYPVTALKPTGAGDSFMAGFLTGLAAGQDVKAAVLRGSACAAIVVAKAGCAPAMPYPADLEKFLSTHPGPTPAP